MAAPHELCNEDRMRGTQVAVSNRRYRADFRRAIAGGGFTVEEVMMFAQSDPVLASMRVSDFVRSFRSVGDLKTRRIMDTAGISPKKRVGGLGERQYKALADALAPYSA